MATRHQAREVVTTLLYANDIGNKDIEKFTDEILEDKKIRNRQKDFALSLYNGVIEHLDSIDKELNSHMQSWDFDKVGRIERAILRLGTYELMYSDLDRAVIINEALEIVKKLADTKATKFVNGVLDAVRKRYS